MSGPADKDCRKFSVTNSHVVTVPRRFIPLFHRPDLSHSSQLFYNPAQPPPPLALSNTQHTLYPLNHPPPSPSLPVPSVCLPSIGVTLTVVVLGRSADGTPFDVGFFSFPPLRSFSLGDRASLVAETWKSSAWRARGELVHPLLVYRSLAGPAGFRVSA